MPTKVGRINLQVSRSEKHIKASVDTVAGWVRLIDNATKMMSTELPLARVLLRVPVMQETFLPQPRQQANY